MITQRYSALMLSPITDVNLQPAAETAKAAGLMVVNINDAVMPQAEHYVGVVQRDNGVRVARWFIQNRPQGGKVAVVEGKAGVYAAGQRTDGFKTDDHHRVRQVPGGRQRAGQLGPTALLRRGD